MTSKKRLNYQLVEDVLTLLRRKWPIVALDGFKLSKEDTSIIHDAVCLNTLLWTDCLGRRTFTGRNALTWVSILMDRGLDVYLDAAEYADQILISDSCQSYQEFITLFGATYPEQVSLIKPLRDKIEQFYVSASVGRADELQEIRSCLLFMSRLTLSSYELAEQTSFAKFDDCMNRIAQVHTLPTERMCEFASSLFPNKWEDLMAGFVPFHGNGSVAERRDDQKPLTEWDKWLYTNTSTVQFVLRRCGIRPISNRLPVAPSNRCARISSVPKGTKKRRIICMEPTHLMFLQQGMRKVLDFRRTPLRSHVDLERAHLNTKLAQEGSISRSYATIDLSSASDSVRWDFVKHLFHKNECLQRLLQLCRSTQRIHPDGSVHDNVHFAPMGSALCFAAEILVFCSIVMEAFWQVYEEQHGTIVGYNPCRETWRVYGDDIIVPEKIYDKVIELLDFYGFIPNLEKTFHGDQAFRESCGGHYYNGFDVTPLRLARTFRGFSFLYNGKIRNINGVKRKLPDPTATQSLIDLSNRSFGRFECLHGFLAGYILRACDYNLYVTTQKDNTAALRVTAVLPTVAADQDRKNGFGTWLQYPEKRVLVTRAKQHCSLPRDVEPFYSTGAYEDVRMFKALSTSVVQQSDTQIDAWGDSDREWCENWRPCL